MATGIPMVEALNQVSEAEATVSEKRMKHLFTVPRRVIGAAEDMSAAEVNVSERSVGFEVLIRGGTITLNRRVSLVKIHDALSQTAVVSKRLSTQEQISVRLMRFKPMSGQHSSSSSPHPRSSEKLFNEALQALRANGQRITGARKAILGILIAEHGPFSAEEIHGRLPEDECDLVTVYRTLAAMEEINIVRRCDFGDGTYRYEFNDLEHHHHHIICRVCRSVHVIEVCVADALERIARQMGYANVTHTLEIFGVCPKCQKAEA
jgi:Fur family ferric uptake transcriptional regulator